MSSEYNRKWIIDNAIPFVDLYKGNLTLRALHYKLVGIGMTNDLKHYKKVVTAMIWARWEGILNFTDFLDYERETIGFTPYKETVLEDMLTEAKEQIKLWATSYQKNMWENQDYYPEVFIEKKALRGVFEPICKKYKVALNPCKGYPSLTYLYDAMKRFNEASVYGEKKPVILYFGDYDCSGENIPETIVDNLYKMGIQEVELKRIMLTKEQVIKMNLPPAPTKLSDTRSRNWDGIGQVELDAVDPEIIQEYLTNELEELLDRGKYYDLLNQQEEEEEIFRKDIKENINKLLK